MNCLLTYITPFLFFISIGFTCCPGELDIDKVEITKLDVWLNLMPGSAPKFHISGDALLLTANFDNSSQPFIRTIKIIQNDLQLYSFHPAQNFLKEDVGSFGMKEISFEFLSEGGLKYNPDINADANVNVEIIFGASLNIKNAILKDVKLVKAY